MLNQDLPIEKAIDDKLNRAGFANQLAGAITGLKSPGSFTIGLYGEWGSGKTSVINMVTEYVIGYDKDIIIVNFNPWLFSDSDKLVSQFFKQLSKEIKIKKPALDSLWKVIDEYSESLAAVKYIPVIGEPLKHATDAIAGHAKKKNAENEDLKTQKEKIIEFIKKESVRLLIIIDDLDRLSENEIVAVFQLVKALADFPGTVYLLAFDYDIVVNALNKVHEGRGQSYLEKIVQVPFQLPSIDANAVRGVFLEQLNCIIQDAPQELFDSGTWQKLYHYGISNYITSIRDAIRFNNVFSMKYALLKDEIDIVDLLGITCLQVFEHDIFSSLQHFKNELCGSSVYYSYQSGKDEETKEKKCIDLLFSVSVKDMQSAKSVIAILFPRVSGHMQGFSWLGSPYDNTEYTVRKKAASPNSFDRYFSLHLENEAIPDSIIKRCLFDASETELLGIIDSVYQKGKLVRWFEEVEAYVDSKRVTIPHDRVHLLIKTITTMWIKYDVPSIGPLQLPFVWNKTRLIEGLLKKLSMNERDGCLNQVFDNKQVSMRALSEILSSLESENARLKEENSVDSGIVRQQEIDNLKSIFKERARVILESDDWPNVDADFCVLMMIENIDRIYYSSVMGRICSNPRCVTSVISGCMAHSATLDFDNEKNWVVDKKIVSKYLVPQDAYLALKEYVHTEGFATTKDSLKMDVGAFLLDMELHPTDDNRHEYSELEIRKRIS